MSLAHSINGREVFLYGKQDDGPHDVKWSPLPIDIGNTRGLANYVAIPETKLKWLMCVYYNDTHTILTGTQQRCFAAEIGMVVVLPRASSLTEIGYYNTGI